MACWNAADIIHANLTTVLQQTLPLTEILIVDNASTDGTADLHYPENVTVVRNPLNIGMSGAVATALQYARDHHYDWLWVLDADSRPRADALELLHRLLESLGPSAATEIGIVG